MADDANSQAKGGTAQQAKPGIGPDQKPARPPAKAPAGKPVAAGPGKAPAKAPVKTPVKAPGRAPLKGPAKAPAARGPAHRVKKAPARKRAARVAPKAPPGALPPRKPAKAPLRPDRRLAGIRAAAGELSRALDAVEKARATLEDSFSRAASGNLSRARGAIETLKRLSESGPLLDVRRLERELAVLVEGVGDLRAREGKGRKRDLLAVDEFLGDAASRLEMAVTPAAGSHLKVLSERLSGLEALRRSHQAAIAERFRARLEGSRKVLGALSDSCARLDGRALGGVARELESALCVCRAFPVGKLSGKSGDLYNIDGLVKRLDRRLARVQALLALKKEPTDG